MLLEGYKCRNKAKLMRTGRGLEEVVGAWGKGPGQPVRVPGSYFGFPTSLLCDLGWRSFLSSSFIQSFIQEISTQSQEGVNETYTV